MKNDKPIVLIRTDGNNKIGMGHIFRSIALSNELKKVGFEIHFLFSDKNNLKKLSQFGKCHIISNDESKELKEIQKIKPKIIIIDLLKKFFPYKKRYFIKIKKSCELLTTIDYSGNELKFVDLGFHSLFGPKKNKANQSFFDLKYCIVRNDFKKESFVYNIKHKVDSILILQGGADTNCISPKIIKAVSKTKNSLKITVVLGQAFDCWEDIIDLQKKMGNKLTVIHDVKNIQKIMSQHQIVISAAGTTLSELLTIGIPTIVVYGHAHEYEMAKIIKKHKMAIILGNGAYITQKAIRLQTDKLIDDFKLRKEIHRNSKKIMDGKGGKRIVSIILNKLNGINSQKNKLEKNKKYF